MKKNILWITILILILKSSFLLAQNIVINEFQSSNITTIKDEDGDYSDWIELYNSGSTTVNLSGYGLSDDITLPLKWKFPAVTLSPGNYMLIWASNKNRATAGNPLHTNFKIGASGDNILLSDASGTKIDQTVLVNF